MINITGGKAFATSFHPTRPFLCDRCEELLSTRGERVVGAECLRKDGSFRLRDKLLAAEPVELTDTFKAYANVSSVDVDAYIYFAISIFWRASATRWPIAKGKVSKNRIGERYLEEFRRYLNGESPLPENSKLTMSVFSDEDGFLQVLWPESQKVDGYRMHYFLIPGIKFEMFLGKLIPDRIRQVFQRDQIEMAIFLEQFRGSGIHRMLMNAALDSRQVGKLRVWSKQRTDTDA